MITESDFMKFSDIPYERADADLLIQSINEIVEEFKGAKSAKAQLDIIKKLEQTQKHFDTMSTLAYIRHTINTNDSFYEAEKSYYDEKGPLIAEAAQRFNIAMLESPFRDGLEKELGKITFINTEMEIKSFSPEIIPLMQEESALESEYQKLYASAKISFQGQILTVAQLGPFKQSGDRQVRKDATFAEGRFFDENREKFDEIFDKLVKNRTKQAKKLGFESYVELGYLRRGRNCYGPREVEIFRNQIIRDVVPLAGQITENIKRRIGVDNYKYYDKGYSFPDGNPTPKGSPQKLIEAARKMYSEMSPETADFIKLMVENELFDLLAKEGKAPGGYCTSLSEYKYPFIFSNFNGTSADVDVLTHEAGHAFADYIAERTIKWDMLSMPSMEGAETHSMSMEFLTSPWHHLFFGDDTKKYQISHAEDALLFLPYGTMVDHFQETVYRYPEMTPEERNQTWAGLEKIYRPYIDFEGIPFYGRGAGWQRQLHIYIYPFYYIDYCMAQTMSLEFFAMHLANPHKAWETYLDFVKRGGSDTFTGLVKSAGLASPLEEGTLRGITGEISKWLKKMY